jgi:tetratricopeptide (TPR) repeat protein
MNTACGEHQDEDCVARVQHVLAQDPLNYDGLFQDGLINIAKGETAKAIREFEYLSTMYGRNSQVRYQLARAYLLSAKGQNPNNAREATDTAESRLKEAIEIDPHFAPAALLYAELKIDKGTPAAATDALIELLKQQPQSKSANYLLAAAYRAQQLRQPALRIYRQMTELFPADPEPWYQIGLVLLGQNQRAEAGKAFEKSAVLSLDYMPAVERLVEIDVIEKRYDAALELAQKRIDENPKNAQAWAMRARIYRAQLDFARAEQDLLKAIELDPQLEPAYLLLAQLYVATNKQDEAIAKLDVYVREHNDFPALMELATIQQQLKNYPATRDAYERSLTIAPDFVPALNNLAEIYSEQLGDLDKALVFANKARNLAPNVPQIADTLGWIYFKKGDYGTALPLLQEAAAKLLDVPNAQFHLGIGLYMVGQEEASRAALQKAVSAVADFPGKDEARARLALLAIDPRSADAGARADLEKFLQERPNDPAALARLAALQQRDGQLTQAIRTYEKILADNPRYAPATRQLALLYAELPSDANATKAFDFALKARDADPSDPEIAKMLGILSYRRKLYPRSLDLFKEASAKRKDDGEILYYLGETHYQLQQWSECKAALVRALILKVPTAIADAAKRTLAQCADNIPESTQP